MNEHTLNDPRLQSLEARLAAAAPQLPPAAQRQLLYECAFAAGQRTSRGSLRRWRAAAAVLLVVLLGLSVSLPHETGQLARQEIEWHAPVEVAAPHRPVQVERHRLHEIVRGQPPMTVELDAWQIERSDPAPFAEALARLDSAPHRRSLTVGRLTRAALEP